MLNIFSLLSLLLSITTAEFGSLSEKVRTTPPEQHVITKLSCWSVQQGVCFRAVFSMWESCLFIYFSLLCFDICSFFQKEILQSLFLKH